MSGETGRAMVEKESENRFFVTAEAARAAIARLSKLKIHPHFSGYLAAVAAAAQEGKATGLKVNFKRFYDDYLLVGGAPDKKPYLQPFSTSASGPQLFNRNVPGSYAPSSLRGVAPILSIVEFVGQGQQVRHNLKVGHEEIAFRVLTNSERVPVTSLATFLFRDHAIPHLAATPLQSVVAMFSAVFGYASNGLQGFDQLYVQDPETFEKIVYSEADNP